jgi:hypothetical protein
VIQGRDTFVAEKQHELYGLILDAAKAGGQRDGAELGMWLKRAMIKADALLAALYDQAMADFQNEYDQVAKPAGELFDGKKRKGRDPVYED